MSPYGFSIAVYVISIMIAIGGIALGLGYALNEKRMKEFGRRELYECAINGAIVGGLFLLFVSGGPVSAAINQLTLSSNTTLNCGPYMADNAAMCLSYDYLVSPQPYTFTGVVHTSVLSQVGSTITGLMILNGILGGIAGGSVDLIVVQFSASYAITPIISEITYIVKILSTVAISVTVQAAVLEFAAAGVLTVLLPAGVILRTFYPTRKLGGFLMAVSIGLYVVLPLSYVFNATLVNTYSSVSSGQSITQVSLNATGAETQLFHEGTAQSTNSTSQNSAVGGVLSLISNLINTVSGLINWILGELAYFIVYAFVLPLFSLIVTGISIREIAELLGSEARFGNFKML